MKILVLPTLDENRAWVEKKFNSISNKLSTIANRVTAVELEQKEHVKTLDFYEAEIEDSKNKLMSVTNECAKLKTNEDVSRITRSIKKIEDDNTLKTLVVSGMPMTKKEDLQTIITLMCSKLDISCKNSDIDGIYRARHSQEESLTRTPLFFIQFNNMLARDSFYDSRKSMAKREFDSKTLGFPTNDKIYINEQLSKPMRELFFMARQRKKELCFKYCWTFHGTVYMRKEKSSDPIRISSSACLKDLR